MFDAAAEILERATSLDRMEARGTLRIAVKQGGFDPKTIDARDLRTVAEVVLPVELAARGVEDATSVVEQVVARLPRSSGSVAAIDPLDE